MPKNLLKDLLKKDLNSYSKGKRTDFSNDPKK